MTKQKQSPSDLALWGGSSLFAEPLYVGRPNIGERQAFLDRIGQIFESRFLSNHGPLVREFEAKIADFLGVKHCIAICNGTIALEILARALGLKPGDEVILPSFTFVATAHALEWMGLKPVFAEIDPQTHSLDPQKVESLINPQTRAILGVHLWGAACAVDALQALAQKHGLELFFDAAHALGCTYRGKKIGHFGRAEVLSFHATKFINCFEGGAIVTNDSELAALIQRMKNFGFVGFDQVEFLGTNGKMHEASAAMGLTSLESLPDFIRYNQTNYQQFQTGIAEIPGLSLYAFDPQEENNYQYIVVEVEPSAYGCNRDQLVKILQAENIIARRYFYPGCHRMAPYRERSHTDLSQTEWLCERILALPTGTMVSSQEVEAMLNLLNFIQHHGPEISEWMQSTP